MDGCSQVRMHILAVLGLSPQQFHLDEKTCLKLFEGLGLY